jgi:5-methylcytosine-specific restriction endonuclease McrBC GTP-binding regulatory subunit McrB
VYYPTAKDLGNAKKMPTRVGRALDAEVDKINCSKTLKTPDPKYPLRRRFFLTDPTKTVLKNYFEYRVDQNAVFHEYRILDLGTKNRKKLRKLVNTVIEELPCLKNHGDDLAANHIDTIVAWKSLHGGLQSGKSKLEDGVQTVEWGPVTIPDGHTSFNIRLELVKTISPNGLSQYTLGNPNYKHENFDDVARCLKIAISKSFGSKVAQAFVEQVLCQTCPRGSDQRKGSGLQSPRDHPRRF